MSYGRRSAVKAAQPQEVKSAVIYARVSTKEQEQEGYSLDAQLGLLRRYAQEKGLHVIAEFVEAETAKEAGRTEFQCMLGAVNSSGAGAILCEKIDRLYRNLSDRVRVGELDVELHFVKEGTVLTPSSKSHEKFIHDIKLVVAKNYIDNLSEETRKGMEEKARQGIWPSCAPYGYVNIVEGNRRTIRLDEELAPKIRRLFDAYAEDGLSLSQTKDLARDLGLRSRSGSVIYTSGIAQILSNPIYCGLIQWNGRIYPGTHKPVVSKALFERVQETMHGRSRNKTGFGVLDFAYKGVLSCAHCGCAITSERKKGKYVYYHCTGRKGKCPGQRCIEEKQITAQISRELERLRIDPEILELLRGALLESLAEERELHDDQRKAVETEAKNLEKKLETLYIDKLTGQVPLAVYEKLKSRWESELESCKIVLGSLGKAQSSYFELGVTLLELGSNCHLRFEKANPNDKRELLKTLCSNCLYDGRNVQLLLQEPFKSMLEICQKNGENREIENWLPD